jgi:hypothetical protein
VTIDQDVNMVDDHPLFVAFPAAAFFKPLLLFDLVGASIIAPVVDPQG